MPGFDLVNFKDKPRRKGKITLFRTGMTKKDTVNAWYSNNGICAEATVGGNLYTYRYELPKNAAIETESVKPKAKKGCMKIYFNKTTDFLLEQQAAEQEIKKDSDSN